MHTLITHRLFILTIYCKLTSFSLWAQTGFHRLTWSFSCELISEMRWNKIHFTDLKGTTHLKRRTGDGTRCPAPSVDCTVEAWKCHMKSDHVLNTTGAFHSLHVHVNTHRPTCNTILHTYTQNIYKYCIYIYVCVHTFNTHNIYLINIHIIYYIYLCIMGQILNISVGTYWLIRQFRSVRLCLRAAAL